MPTRKSLPSLQETQNVARALFGEFTREQFSEEGINGEELSRCEDTLASVGALNGHHQIILASVGRDLRRISDTFAKSRERQEVRNRAQSVTFGNLTSEQFHHLLQELFQDGISRERIVVLFFFCSDLAIRAFRSQPITYFRNLIKWSLDYIINTVCAWVQSQGGWEIVLGDYFPKVVFTTFAILGCVAFAVYIKKNWSSSTF